MWGRASTLSSLRGDTQYRSGLHPPVAPIRTHARRVCRDPQSGCFDAVQTGALRPYRLLGAEYRPASYKLCRSIHLTNESNLSARRVLLKPGNNDLPSAGNVRLAAEDGVFELAGAAPAWIWVLTCPTPSCPCRTALVLATHDGREHLLERAAAVRDAWNAQTDYSAAAAALDDLVVFHIDIDTAEVFSPRGDKPLNLSAHPRIADIATRIDGDLLESIGELWYRGKGWPDPKQETLSAAQIKSTGWQRGEMLAWDDACISVRQDYYVLNGRLYEAAEMYCPLPECECGEVLIHFETLKPRGAPSPGDVTVKRSGETQILPNKKGRDRLEQLWTAFRTRHPNHLARFARRYPIMKSIGARIVATPPALPPKAGRNDSCPCGSGKKYKRCCGTS